METITCPKGHPSSEPDFCSECGAKIQSAKSVTTPAHSSSGKCPDCEADRAPDGSIFCEVCGYNFATGAHGEVPIATTQPTSAPAIPTPPAASPAPLPKGWAVTVAVDPSLGASESPAPPVGVEPFAVSLDKPVSLIGRRSESRAIFPEIALNFDVAVSHRHALLQRVDSGLLLRDIGAANGTRLNGKDIASMVDTPLKDGD